MINMMMMHSTRNGVEKIPTGVKTGVTNGVCVVARKMWAREKGERKRKEEDFFAALSACVSFPFGMGGKAGKRGFRKILPQEIP